MARYNKVSQELLDELLALLGKHNMTTDPEKLDAYKTDEESNPIYFTRRKSSSSRKRPNR